MKIAVLFGFCASARDPETAMLSAIAACCSSDGDESEGVRMTGISRATVTERGEYCVKQVLSLEVLVKGVRLPTANTLNAVLPQSVRVFKVIRVDKSFSARRMCDFRTYEYLIPTYAFAPPPPQTGFPFRSDVESFDVLVNSSATTDSVFDTMKKAAATVKQSAASLRSRSKSRERSSANTNDVDSPITVTPTRSSISLPSAGSAFPDDEDDDGPVLVKASDSDSQSKKSSLLQKGGRSSLSPFPDDDDDIVGFETKVTPSGNIALPSTSPTATQSLIYQDPQANLPPLNHHHYKPSKQSRGPIDLLPTTEEDRSLLKRYRITPAQLDKIHSILEQYRGSHDWHNYMPALQQEQGGFENPFHRITNVSCSKPQFHYGMEWIQVQVSAPQPLPRGLFRSMMAMLVMVVRTNTPQSMIAASFGRGVAKIEGLPLAPVRGSGICDIGYNSWNESAAAQEGLIKFADDQNYVEGFAEGSVRDEVFIEEEDGMEFEEWLKEVDRHSYLYKHFLNARGVIRRDFV
ncbi:pseudouridine synthase [Obelidium mucronatum]|nr:pseudouridine synthase [Obelidium mucronatum]